MHLRLGLLQDPAVIEKQATRAAAEAQAKKLKSEIPTVRTEAQMKADEAAEKDNRSGEKSRALSVPKPKIRPLSEAKAIDSGASFVSEGFLLLVGVGLIIFENWRSKRKETSRREDVADKINELEENERASRRALVELEKEILRLRSKNGIATEQRILPKEVWELENEEEKEPTQSKGWWSWIRKVARVQDDSAQEQSPDLVSADKRLPSEKPSSAEFPKLPDPAFQPRVSLKPILHFDTSAPKPESPQTKPTNG